MSDFEQSIYGLIPEMDEHAVAMQSEQERLERAEARRIAKEQEDARLYAEADVTSLELAGLVVRILERESVDDVGIIARRKSGYLNEYARGWHVYSYDDKNDRTKKIEHVGLNKRGDVLVFDVLTANSNGVDASGIISPVDVRDARRRLEIVQSDLFKKGVASLIGGHGPYTQLHRSKPD